MICPTRAAGSAWRKLGGKINIQIKIFGISASKIFKLLSPIIIPKIIKWTKRSWKTFEETVRPGRIRR